MMLPVPNDNRLVPLRGKPVGQLLIHEIYKSIQGESTFAGLPCVFVRLTACSARCVWCDTPHAFTEGTLYPLKTVLAKIQALACPLVELTGGEPLLQPEAFTLMTALADAGQMVLLETSGTVPIKGVDPRIHIIMDLKCPDSGECANNLWENLAFLKPTDEIKFVIASKRDFDWTVGVVEQHGLDRRFTLLLSAVFAAVELTHLADWVLDSGVQMRLQLQLHKYIWPPEARGV